VTGQDDAIRIAQLLTSRLCHDLVGSVGAVSTGLELLGEEADGLDSEALALASKSAGQMGRKVTFFRIAFGAGFTGRGGPLAEALSLAEGFLADRTVRLDAVALAGKEGAGLSEGAAKILLNLILIAADSLPRGGIITVDGDQGTLKVAATGERAALKVETQTGLATDAVVAGLDARSVHGFFTRNLVEAAGGQLDIEAGEGVIRLQAVGI